MQCFRSLLPFPKFRISLVALLERPNSLCCSERSLPCDLIVKMDRGPRTGTCSKSLDAKTTENSSDETEFSSESEEDDRPPGSDSKRLCTHKKAKAQLRKFDPPYIKFGFVKSGDDAKPTALFVVCQDVRENGCLNPSKLQRHLRQKYPKLMSRPRPFFQLAVNDLRESQDKLMRQPLTAENEISLRLASKIGRAGEPHIIGERPVEPCLLETAKCLWTDRHVKRVATISSSNNTVCRRIADLGVS